MLKFSALLLLILGLIVGGYFLFKEFLPTQNQKNEEPKLTSKVSIATGYWPGSYWVDVAKEKGFFERAGLDIEVIDTSSDYLGSLKDAAEGKIDTNSYTLYDFIQFNAQGLDLVGVIVVDRSFGADQLIAKKNIQSLTDLKGKTIGLDKDTYMHYYLEEILKKEFIDQSEVNIVDIQVENATQELKKPEIDAVFTYYPFSEEVIQQIDSHTIFNSSQTPNLGLSVQAFQREFVEQKPEEVQKIMSVWFRGNNYINENPEEAYSIIAKAYNVTPEDVKNFTEIVKTINLEENKTYFSYSAGNSSIYNIAKNINKFLVNKGLVQEELNTNEVFEPKFVKALQ